MRSSPTEWVRSKWWHHSLPAPDPEELEVPPDPALRLKAEPPEGLHTTPHHPSRNTIPISNQRQNIKCAISNPRQGEQERIKPGSSA